ncbi:hypothetical protein KIPB_004221 [Kipferlia bialata]|uniref:Uncharacterized protein n=1 Tax=Kipferlia bialata TaxID=797122 RepID=A0A9K3CV37_9EUKA|nr:hypothetical protein KIPB_004221 [Kipferlia bialata]|eukprot:g4221.t1
MRIQPLCTDEHLARGNPRLICLGPCALGGSLVMDYTTGSVYRVQGEREGEGEGLYTLSLFREGWEQNFAGTAATVCQGSVYVWGKTPGDRSDCRMVRQCIETGAWEDCPRKGDRPRAGREVILLTVTDRVLLIDCSLSPREKCPTSLFDPSVSTWKRQRPGKAGILCDITAYCLRGTVHLMGTLDEEDAVLRHLVFTPGERGAKGKKAMGRWRETAMPEGFPEDFHCPSPIVLGGEEREGEQEVENYSESVLMLGYEDYADGAPEPYWGVGGITAETTETESNTSEPVVQWTHLCNIGYQVKQGIRLHDGTPRQAMIVQTSRRATDGHDKSVWEVLEMSE